MTEPEPFVSRRAPGEAPSSDPGGDPSIPWTRAPRGEAGDPRVADGTPGGVYAGGGGEPLHDEASANDGPLGDDPAYRDPAYHDGVFGDGDPHDPDVAPEEQGRGSVRSLMRELPVLILVAFVLAFVLRTFVVQVFYIPSSSMEPTLQVNDRILVDKMGYRFRDLRRGEIVVFEGDQIAGPEVDGLAERALRGLGQLIGVTPANARDFVKRVVGLPGDEIFIDDSGNVHVNGVRLTERYLGQGDPRSCGPLVVPEGKLFFLGDNRGNSSDSRASLGYVPVDHVVGRAFVTIWPVDRIHLLPRPSYGPVPASGSSPPSPDEVPAHDICNPR